MSGYTRARHLRDHWQGVRYPDCPDCQRETAPPRPQLVVVRDAPRPRRARRAWPYLAAFVAAALLAWWLSGDVHAAPWGAILGVVGLAVITTATVAALETIARNDRHPGGR